MCIRDSGISCTIGPNGSVNGSVTQSGDGSLVIRGAVNGSVTEDGVGDVVLARGARVGGDVSENGIGNVSVRGGASIDGAIEESGDGSVNVTVDVPGIVKGNIYENGNGGVTVNATSGNFEGSVSETGPGNVAVDVYKRQVLTSALDFRWIAPVASSVMPPWAVSLMSLGLSSAMPSLPSRMRLPCWSWTSTLWSLSFRTTWLAEGVVMVIVFWSSSSSILCLQRVTSALVLFPAASAKGGGRLEL